MLYSRRDLGKLALAGVPAARLTGLMGSSNAFANAVQAGKPNSRFAGVAVGLNVPYSFRGQIGGTVEDILDVCSKTGVSFLELRMQPVEYFLQGPAPYPGAVARGGGAAAPAAGPGRAAGAPAGGAAPAEGAARQGGGGGGRGAAPAPTPEQIAAQKTAADELKKWRLALPMSRVREVRKKFDDAGVTIDVMKVDPFDSIWTTSEAEVNYFFEMAKTLGARAISCELLDYSIIATKLLGSLAEANKLPVAYHGHGQPPADFDAALNNSKFNYANIDIGHFTAANNVSPVEYIKKIHTRITHIHVKDRKMHGGVNMPFGQGETPIREVLQLIRDNKWPITATIEYEYPVPAGSTVLAELQRSVQYCKDCLLG